MNNVMIKIDGRDALPLRAIPYVTNWQESPDSLVRVLAAPKTKKFCGKNIRIKHSELFAYRADDEGNYAQINHKQWERSVLAIDNLTGNFKANEREGELYGNHDAWRTAAVLILPDNAFIWLDEFQAWYSRTRQPEINSDNLSDAPTDDDVEQQSDMLDFVQCFPAEIESRLWRYSSDFASTAQRKEDEPPAPATPIGTNESGKMLAAPASILPPIPKQRFQEQEILRVIHELGHDPKALPRDVPGVNGVKAAVRGRLNIPSNTFRSLGVFDKAWERLSSTGDIWKHK